MKCNGNAVSQGYDSKVVGGTDAKPNSWPFIARMIVRLPDENNLNS